MIQKSHFSKTSYIFDSNDSNNFNIDLNGYDDIQMIQYDIQNENHCFETNISHHKSDNLYENNNLLFTKLLETCSAKTYENASTSLLESIIAINAFVERYNLCDEATNGLLKLL